MTQSLITHRIKAGERWDLLAYRYYGDPLNLDLLIKANPHIAFCEVLPQGEVMFIPVIKAVSATDSDLPPWLQGGADE